MSSTHGASLPRIPLSVLSISPFAEAEAAETHLLPLPAHHHQVAAAAAGPPSRCHCRAENAVNGRSDGVVSAGAKRDGDVI